MTLFLMLTVLMGIVPQTKANSVVYTFYDSAPASSAPVVTGTLSVSPGNQYSVKVEIYLTDLDASSEYATITIGGKNMGDCNPNFSAAQSGCYWYDCSNDLSGGSILASSGQIAVVATYTSAVGCCTCAWKGVNTLGIIRITLTQETTATTTQAPIEMEIEDIVEFLQSPEAAAVAARLALLAATPPPLPTFVPQGTPPPTAGGPAGGGAGGTGGTGGGGAGTTGGYSFFGQLSLHLAQFPSSPDLMNNAFK